MCQGWPIGWFLLAHGLIDLVWFPSVSLLGPPIGLNLSLKRWYSRITICFLVLCLIKSALQFFSLLIPRCLQAIQRSLKLVSRIYFCFPPHSKGGHLASTLFLLFLFCDCLFTTSDFLLDYVAGKMIFIGKRDLRFCSSKGNTGRQYYQFNILTNNWFFSWCLDEPPRSCRFTWSEFTSVSKGSNYNHISFLVCWLTTNYSRTVILRSCDQ